MAEPAIIKGRTDLLYNRLESCDICPRNCGADRLNGETGYCGAGRKARVYTAFLHQGEEPGISAKAGSGTIFFSGCNLKCGYCQNWRFSHLGQGTDLSENQLSNVMLKLQKQGAANINLVTPTHFLPQILSAVLTALKKGLKIPLVYNTSGYEKGEIVELMDGIIDVYLVDMRYISPAQALKYSQAENYPVFNHQAIRAMYSQKKGKNIWQDEVLTEGLIIRHLALPGFTRETCKILCWIKENAGQSLVSVMFQYQPYFRANIYPEINRCLSGEECRDIQTYVQELGLEGWVQDYNPQETLAGVHFEPADFNKTFDL